MRKAKAFCPGHVTGFFEICRAKTPLAAGSRGAGFCLTLGARSEIRIEESAKQRIHVSINGRRATAEVTKGALKRLLGDDMVKASVLTTHDLPVGQGFGMSAAGSLSASLAMAELRGNSRQDAFEAAHIAEIVHGGGLGDVSALHRGGITVRTRPGLPPIGRVVRIDGDPELVLCVVGKKMLTGSVLANPTRVRSINASGSRKTNQLLRELTLDKLMTLSAEFTVESGLASARILEAMSAASKLGAASMSMLGNSVFAHGDTAGLERVLSDFGETYVCRVDTRGPRLL